MKILFLLLLFLSKSWAEPLPVVIDQAKKSVVAVGTFSPKRSPKSVFLGTGFTILDGTVIVTNAHVLPKKIDNKSFEVISVFVRDKKQIRMYEVRIVAVDKVHDIAILKLLSGRLPALTLGERSQQVREGELIAFTGFPIGMVLGLFPVTHQGIISAITPIAIPMLKSRQLNAKMLKRLRNPFLVYQLDATAYPGNSGSPVYEQETGVVIGIINKVFVKESKETILSKPSGITYAIPIKYLYDLLDKK